MDKPFELDEPAAKSHTPPGWPIQVIEITPSGKAPKKYGPTAYRFGAAMTLSVILPRRGWTLVKQTKTYAYLIPPPGHETPPFHISIAVPTPEESLEIARRSYEKAQSWVGQLGEWPAWYFHERNTDMREMWRDPATGAMDSVVHKGTPISSLSIGQWGAWNVDVTGEAGRFGLGVLPPAAENFASPEPSAVIMLEGTSRILELTRYERNAAARRLCIEHYGLCCQACGMSYEEKYGPLGADLIHIHHVTPLAAAGCEHEVDPIHDLIPLCASCHHVVHQNIPPYSVKQVRDAIDMQARKNAGAL
ncbi:HNH endonuclease [Agrobacterium tumefaciens]|uniref:HNH endonuclease n=1 Tax=Agrobacterium tumefaciens TaxID=358 RepID=UPI001572EBD2